MWQYKYEYLGSIFSSYSKYVISNAFFYRGVLNGTSAYRGNVKLSSRIDIMESPGSLWFRYN